MKPFQKYLILPATFLLLSQAFSLAQDKTKSPMQPLITVPEPHPSSSSALDAKPQSVDKIVDAFFVQIEKGQIDQAYDQLTAGTTIAQKTADVGLLKSKTSEAVKVFGAVDGYELVGIKNVGTHLMCSTYLSLGKSLPLRWKFYFYKSDQAWRLIDIRVDDRLVDMFEDKGPSAKSAEGQ